MNATQLLQHFDRLTEAPDAVPRLRRFILDLAVRGKLVEQDAGDEPAAELLKRIALHKAGLVKAGLLKEQPVAVDVPSSKQLFSVRPNWKWATFGCVMISRDGERIPVSKEDRNLRAKLYDYYGASGAIDKIDGFLFDRPLLLVGEDGANLINRSTPIAFIARGKYWVNNHAHVLDAISEGFLKYVELFINAIDLKAYVTGTAQPKMNQAKMNSIPVAIPPEAEQHRIVAKVDELMALCDQLEAAQQERERRRDRLAVASLQRLNQPAASTTPEAQREHVRFHLQHLPRLTMRPEHIKAMRQTIFSLAIEGHLMPQCGVDEHADAAFARLGLESEAIVSDRAAFPATWRRVTFDRVAAVTGGVTLGRKLVRGKTMDLPYLRVANVKRGELDLSFMKEITIGEAELDRYALKLNDLLLTEGGDWDKVTCRCVAGRNSYLSAPKPYFPCPLAFNRAFCKMV